MPCILSKISSTLLLHSFNSSVAEAMSHQVNATVTSSTGPASKPPTSQSSALNCGNEQLQQPQQGTLRNRSPSKMQGLSSSEETNNNPYNGHGSNNDIGGGGPMDIAVASTSQASSSFLGTSSSASSSFLIKIPTTSHHFSSPISFPNAKDLKGMKKQNA
jgi:hypothetical protein